MTRVASYLPVVAVLLSVLGCARSNDHQDNLDSAQTRSGPEWTLQMKSVCPDQSQDACLAGYGYAVAADGTYRVGPGPDGQVLTGSLSTDESEELRRLTADALSAAGEIQDQSTCQNDGVSISSDSISWTPRSGQSYEWIHAGAKEFCARLSSPDLARKLYAFIQESASRHYPLPFPGGTCDDSTAALDSLYGSVQKCVSDSDCSYFDGNILPISPDVFTFVLTGDCTGAKPMVVGNPSLVSEKRPMILQQIVRAREACKSRSTSSCEGFSVFQPTRPSPVCRAGVCRTPQGG